MNGHLEVRHFGPIEHVSIDLKRITVFIGMQASGKSTLAKLVAIFNTGQFIVNLYEDELAAENQLTHYGIRNYFIDGQTEITYKCKDYQVSYVNNRWALELENTEFGKWFKKNVENRNSNHNHFTLFRQLSASLDRGVEYYFNRPIYIPTERILISIIQDTSFYFKDVPLPQHFIQFGQLFQSATRELPKYNIPFLAADFSFESGQFRQMHLNKSSLPLSETASGIQSLLPMMIVLDHNKTKPSSFIVEEPELNLFPTAQRDLLSFLLGCANSIVPEPPNNVFNTSSNNLLITTHSPYMLSALNIHLYAGALGKKLNDKTGVEELIPRKTWVNADEFAAYNITRNGAINIIDGDLGLISDNFLDEVSEELAAELDELIALEKLIL